MTAWQQEWAETQPWCTGSGTLNQPYVIENLIINAGGTSYGIQIQNSNVSFVIQYCIISNANNDGILLATVNNSLIIDNNCSNNGGDGIRLMYGNNNKIIHNIVNYGDEGIELWANNNTVIYQNTVKYHDAGDGIILGDKSSYNNVTQNDIMNSYSGISIIQGSNFNNITSNNVSNNIVEGIYLTNGHDNLISSNTVSNNTSYGIRLDSESHDTISGNTVMNNSYGIDMDSSNYNSITYNTVSNSTNDGIYMTMCTGNDITSNTINDNKQNGIDMYGDCGYFNITSNTISDNKQVGIKLVAGYSNNITSNKITRNACGILFLADGSTYNNVSENIISDNEFGLSLDGYSENNSIYSNFFLKNQLHAVDNGTGNSWNTTTIGNYWDNYTGIDANDDGIGDTPYIFISGTAGSNDSLPIVINSAPVIMINSPGPNGLWGDWPPNYDISISDPYLYEMWYTLDGGLHNYTITEFTGMIDQSAWNLLNSGMHTVRFYASDKAGNIGYSEVQIKKDITAPTIIIVSPTLDAKFSSPPHFVVKISDASDIYKMWYSLDGGMTEYSFTSNGTINSTAWAALSDGPVTITFHAYDILWNLADQSVTVIKSAPSGLDPVLLTVIIGSVAGGVAIAAVTYIYMRKRSRT